MLKRFPTLYSKTKTGKVQQWTISVTDEYDDVVKIVTEFGQQGGQIQTTFKTIKVGKNLGKANSTTIEEQAISEAESMWKKKQLSNYREVLGENLTLLPMLAHKFENTKINYPIAVQPKLNGVRCLASYKDGKIIFTSRKGKVYENLEHIEKELSLVMEEGDIFDGEIFSKSLDFQEIIKRVKRSKTDRSDINDIKVEYWVYDLVNTTLTFEERFAYLFNKLQKSIFQYVKVTPTDNVANFAELEKWHSFFNREGYEGTMIRNLKGLYLIEHRSYDLLKLKDFLEDEFEIIGGSEGTGRDEGTVIFEVKNNSQNTFKVRPKGSYEQRTQWFVDLEKLIGKKLTVKYQELSQDGIPIFPVGIAIRDYE